MQHRQRRESLPGMGRDILFSVLLGAAVLMGLLSATASLKGWKALLLPFLGIGAILLIWNLVRIHFPR